MTCIAWTIEDKTKNAAFTLPINKICGPNGLERVLAQLDTYYAVYKLSQLDSDLSGFLDCTCEKSLTVEELIAGFHARHDRIAELEFPAIVQGHMMIRNESRDQNEQNMVVGQASGDYNIQRISAALRTAYRKKLPYSASLNTHPGGRFNKVKVPYSPSNPLDCY